MYLPGVLVFWYTPEMCVQSPCLEGGGKQSAAQSDRFCWLLHEYLVWGTEAMAWDPQNPPAQGIGYLSPIQPLLRALMPARASNPHVLSQPLGDAAPLGGVALGEA